jgi:hypothetical protein
VSDAPPWEAFLAEHFPGYLLPAAARRALSAEEAARFLERVSGAKRSLFVLRATSALAAHADEIDAFARSELPRLARFLPARGSVELRATEGRLEGKLAPQVTARLRLEGRPTAFAALTRRRGIDLPENVLLKSVAVRLLRLVRELEALGAISAISATNTMTTTSVTSTTSWSAALPASGAALARALEATPLGAVADEPVTHVHEQAAASARDRGYALALVLHRALEDAQGRASPARLARLVAQGALAPLSAPTRFELAVLVRLVQALEQGLARRAAGRFSLTRALILPGRSEVARFERPGVPSGASLEVFYNQACLAPGAYEAGVTRYLGHRGRLRPDITVIARRSEGAPAQATVIEVKLSSDPGYLAEGYAEALLYRAAFAAELTGWPKAVLVAPAAIASDPRPEDDVIAIAWDRWVPDVIVDGLLRGLGI